MKKYTIRGNYPSGCECSGECRWVEIEAKSQKIAENKARVCFSQAIRITTESVEKDDSDPCPIHKTTSRESELLSAIRGEASGRLTKEMACYLLQTTPQAIGRLALSLSAKNLAHRDGDGTIRLNQ